ncbi:MAG: DUF4476 domain-containing protein [Chitinophagaceae bacterium]
MKGSILVALLANFFTLFAQSKSNLTISTSGENNLKIIYKGEKYSLQDRSVTFQVQEPGTFPLIIYQLQSDNGNSEYKKVYDGTIKLNAGKHSEVTVLRFGKIAADEGDIVADLWNEYYQKPVQTNAGNNLYNYPAATDKQFADIKEAIKGESYDEEKVKMARVTLREISLSANQIKELLNFFSYDDHKLMLAKYAYDYCNEKHAYYLVANTLSYSSNKKKLLDYIATK